MEIVFRHVNAAQMRNVLLTTIKHHANVPMATLEIHSKAAAPHQTHAIQILAVYVPFASSIEEIRSVIVPKE